MPSYDFRCSQCGNIFEEFAPMNLVEEGVPCPSCPDSRAYRVLSMPGVNFTGSGWMAKSIRMSRQKSESNRKLDALADERRADEPLPYVVPNVKGERVDTWKEAQKMAKSRGFHSDSYDPLVYKEQKGR